jgi:hypothetical protein
MFPQWCKAASCARRSRADAGARMTIPLPFSRASFFRAAAQFQFLRHEQFIAEAADFAERRRLDKNERAGEQPELPAGAVPQLRDAAGHRNASRPAAPSCRRPGICRRDLFRHIRKQFRRSDANPRPQKSASRRWPPPRRISGAGNLIDRLKDDEGARRARDFRRAVGGIVVTDNQFRLPTAPGKRARCRFDPGERPPSNFSSLKAGTTIEIFTGFNLVHAARSFNAGIHLRPSPSFCVLFPDQPVYFTA